MAFTADKLVEQEVERIEELPGYIRQHRVTWINVDGLGDAKTIKRLGELFNLHTLALEDVVNVHQRAKVEDYGSQLFVVVRMPRGTERVETEQLSLFLGENFVITFQDLPGDCLDPVRQRIRKSSGRTRKENADYLAYALIDAVVDSYFPIVERIADRLDGLEDQITAHQSPEQNAIIHQLRNELLLLRRAIRPHRDAVNELVRDEHPLVRDETRVFLRDCYDHTSQLVDLLEVYREMAASLRDYYLSIVSNRMNDIMKVLTIIATIFIPLSFIAGLYGMNFDTDLPGNMPELGWPYGYMVALSLMLAVAIGLIVFFRRRGWIGTPRPPT
jgi:magnesium transporter